MDLHRLLHLVLSGRDADAFPLPPSRQGGTDSTSDEIDARENKKTEISIWLEQYRVVNALLVARITLQERNSYVHVALTIGLGGLIFNFLTKNTIANLEISHAAIMLPLIPLASFLFIWRHLDHNSKILDYTDYINTVIRPRLASLIGTDALLLEKYLLERRLSRFRRLLGLSILGNDAIISLTALAPFMGFAWILRFINPNRAGTARIYFDVLLYLDSLLLIGTIYALIYTTKKFGKKEQETEKIDTALVSE